MPHGITGFFAGFQIAIFSFTGIELLGTMTAETRDPQRILPKAINALPLRIIIFYLLSMVVIIAVASWPGVGGDQPLRDAVRQGRAACRRGGN